MSDERCLKRGVPEPENEDEAAPKIMRIADESDADSLMALALQAALEQSRNDYLATVEYQMSEQPVCEEHWGWERYYDDVTWKPLRTDM
eukprot:6252822-Amphidinium_carterae.1